MWKFNNSLISNEDYVEKMKNHISDILNFLNNENIKDDQVIWEYLKYEIRKFSIQYSKRLAKALREERECLERKLKILEQNSESNLNNNPECYECKTELEDIYQIQVDGIRTRSKCMWYEFDEKSSKFFLHLEKNRAIQGQVQTIVSNEKEITDETEINAHIAFFYESLFKEKLSFKNENLTQYLENISMPCLSKEKQDSCEGVITEKELFEALKSMQNNKSPGNDGLSKEFYETFWEELKKPFMYAIQKSYNIKQLCVSQRQAVIKLVEKKGRDKIFTKLISKVLAERLKNVLPDIISKNQTAYVNNRFISEGGRLINDLLEVCDTLNKKGYLVTIDIEKAFDSVSHVFLIAILEKFGFGITFIEWIKILLKNQESCIINGGKTSQYFKLERGTRQGDPISAYLFIIVLEVIFLNIIQNSHIKGIKLFDKEFIYTVYADDTTFSYKTKILLRCY